MEVETPVRTRTAESERSNDHRFTTALRDGFSTSSWIEWCILLWSIREQSINLLLSLAKERYHRRRSSVDSGHSLDRGSPDFVRGAEAIRNDRVAGNTYCVLSEVPAKIYRTATRPKEAGMATYKIEEIEGIGKVFAAKLTDAGIATTAALLKACADPKGRRTLAEKTAIDAERLLKWANMADLMRIRGVGKQYAELLEASGVDTVKELKHRNAANLVVKMAELNDTKKLTRAVPAEKMVAGWIEQAKALSPAITY